eukprot:4820702-Amphidinium_carterae.3
MRYTSRALYAISPILFASLCESVWPPAGILLVDLHVVVVAVELGDRHSVGGTRHCQHRRRSSRSPEDSFLLGVWRRHPLRWSHLVVPLPAVRALSTLEKAAVPSCAVPLEHSTGMIALTLRSSSCKNLLLRQRPGHMHHHLARNESAAEIGKTVA